MSSAPAIVTYFVVPTAVGTIASLEGQAAEHGDQHVGRPAGYSCGVEAPPAVGDQIADEGHEQADGHRGQRERAARDQLGGDHAAAVGSVTSPLDVGGLFRRLAEAKVDFVLIGGLAVNAHGVIRSTKDVDIAPAGDRVNLARLTALLPELEVRQLGVGDFSRHPDGSPRCESGSGVWRPSALSVCMERGKRSRQRPRSAAAGMC